MDVHTITIILDLLLLVGAVLAWNASEARAQSLFGDVSGDGKVTVLDVSMARLIALGVLSPTGAQLDSANVFQIGRAHV